MRPLTVTLAISTLVLALMSLYLYQQLSAARELAHSEQLTERSLRGQLTRLEDVRETLETDLRAARAAHGDVADLQPPKPAAPLSAPVPAGPPWRTPSFTPEQRRVMLRYPYKRAFREAGLSESEIEAAVDVLERQAERQRKEAQVSAPDPQQEQAEMAAALGPDKAERFMAEKKRMPVRSQVSMLRMQLEDGGDPLTPEQQRTLEAKLSEKERSPFPKRVEGEDPQQTSARFQNHMRELDRELRDAASPLLTPTQRKLLEEELKFRDATRQQITFAPAPRLAAPALAGNAAPAPRE